MWITPRDHALVGKCLEGIRKETEVTQQELAQRLGKPQSFISSYETGQRRVDLLEFITILEALGRDAPPVFAQIDRLFQLGKK
ncbi:helix-turn-helix transcriptional regulator [Niveispirillum sp.]|uniref:helix-turn-helix domain-containing protein n=1 Tax=Niveispirillum sp. TaxID=1917217 RepID=UPI001B60B529|nr:helix-turn-helix transcriptional regulator [Niveispirillum sp.]MBP7337204.1 helix-turn-helix transcriptional regulator [Niveispirillum sp.]